MFVVAHPLLAWARPRLLVHEQALYLVRVEVCEFVGVELGTAEIIKDRYFAP